MIYRIETTRRRREDDPLARRLHAAAETLAPGYVRGIWTSRLFFLQGDLTARDVSRLVNELLTDRVLDESTISRLSAAEGSTVSGDISIELARLPGVPDWDADALLEAARLIEVDNLEYAATGLRVAFDGELGRGDAVRLLEKTLLVPGVHFYTVNTPIEPAFLLVRDTQPTILGISLDEYDDVRLEHLAFERRLGLSLPELRTLADHFRKVGRGATDIEVETFARVWSESACRRTAQARIRLAASTAGRPPRHEVIETLLTPPRRVRGEAPLWLDHTKDGLELMPLDIDRALLLTVQTNRKPAPASAVAATSAVLGHAQLALAAANASPLGFATALGVCGLGEEGRPRVREVGLQELAYSQALTAARSGVATAVAALREDARYRAGPLLATAAVGLVSRRAPAQRAQEDDLLVLLGAPTGRDGFGQEPFETPDELPPTASPGGVHVSASSPLSLARLTELLRAAYDAGVVHAAQPLTDGGMCLATVRIVGELGARLHLDRVPLRYAGLTPWEIWTAETSGRVLLSVSRDDWDELLVLAEDHGVDAMVVGRISKTPDIVLRFGGRPIARLPLALLREGRPRRELDATWSDSRITDAPPLPGAPTATAHEGLDSVRSAAQERAHEDLLRAFDAVSGDSDWRAPGEPPEGHAVPGVALCAPPALDGSPTGTEGVALSVGWAADLEAWPESMAWAGVDHALRQLVAAGADPARVAVAAVHAAGDPEQPDRLGPHVLAVRGTQSAAAELGVALLSPTEALGLEVRDEHAYEVTTPTSQIVFGVGVLPFERRAIPDRLQRGGDRIYVLGETADELAGSACSVTLGGASPAPPAPPSASAAESYAVLHRATTTGLVRACRACGPGGLVGALDAMAAGSGVGAKLSLAQLPVRGAGIPDERLAFSETLGRLVIVVPPAAIARFEALVSNQPCAAVGVTLPEPRLRVTGTTGDILLDTETRP